MRPILALTALLTICTIPVVSSAEVVTYQYDVHGRLTQSFKEGGPADGTLTTITNDPTDNRSNYAVQVVTHILHTGDKLYSSDNGFYLTLKGNGNLAVVTASSGAELWTSGSTTLATDRASFQWDGNLVLISAANVALWSTGTYNHPASQLIMQMDGNLVIKDPSGTLLWQTNTGGHLGGTLHIGDKIYSSDNRFYLTLKANGNLSVVTASTSTELWTSGSTTLATDRAIFQSDGNFVLYSATNAALWQSGTYSHPGSQLTMQSDGNLVIRDPTSTLLWQTNTGGH